MRPRKMTIQRRIKIEKKREKLQGSRIEFRRKSFIRHYNLRLHS